MEFRDFQFLYEDVVINELKKAAVHCASVNCSVNCGNLLSSYQEPLHIVGKI
jgi:hypothetical protein